jgi:hypothetical protein
MQKECEAGKAKGRQRERLSCSVHHDVLLIDLCDGLKGTNVPLGRIAFAQNAKNVFVDFREKSDVP